MLEDYEGCRIYRAGTGILVFHQLPDIACPFPQHDEFQEDHEIMMEGVHEKMRQFLSRQGMSETSLVRNIRKARRLTDALNAEGGVMAMAMLTQTGMLKFTDMLS